MRKILLVPALLLAAGLFTAGIPVTNAEAAEKKGKAQTICPVLGDPIDKQFYADYKGYRIYFCCGDCVGKFKADPEKFMKILRDSGVTLEKVPTGGGDHSEHKHTY